MQVQLHGGKLRGASEEAYDAFRRQAYSLLGNVTDPGDVVLPPYYPVDQILLEDWALYLDSVRVTDFHVGRVLERLETEGLLENTLIVFFTDHGISHARGKQFLYDEGTHIPLVVRGPLFRRGVFELIWSSILMSRRCLLQRQASTFLSGCRDKIFLHKIFSPSMQCLLLEIGVERPLIESVLYVVMTFSTSRIFFQTVRI